jgi:hypothetical protein
MAAYLSTLTSGLKIVLPEPLTEAGGQALTDNFQLIDSYMIGSGSGVGGSGIGYYTKLDDWATPDDNTDLNATTGYHGLLPRLSGVVTEFLTGSGTWATPSGAGGLSNIVEDTTPQLGGNLDMNGKTIAGVIATELAYVSGVTSSIQTQLNNKINNTEKGVASGVATLDSSGKLTDTEFPYSFVANTGTLNKVVLNADGYFVSSGDAKNIDLTLYNAITHSTTGWYNLYTNAASGYLTIDINTAWNVHCNLIGITQSCGKRAGFILDGLLVNTSGTVSLSATNIITLYDADDASFDAQLMADNTNKTLLIQTRDSDGASDIVRWVSSLNITSVTFN